MSRRRGRMITGLLLAIVLAGGAGVAVRTICYRQTSITAYFKSAPGIYPNDTVRVAGVRVGTIAAIEPDGGAVKMTLHVDRRVPVPADAKAIIVAQSLVAARYVQLTPAYEDDGATMVDGAVIPQERTAVPVEWDEVKAQLARLATDLGPREGSASTPMMRFIDSAASAMAGNGGKLRHTLHELSSISRVFADGSRDIVGIIGDLQALATTLRDSNQQIVEFQNHFATLTSVVNDRADIGQSLTDLSSAISDIQRFVAGSRDQTVEQLQRLTNVTQNLVDHKLDIENILHVAPNSIANAYNIYNPDTHSQIGAFVLNMLSDPTGFVCGNIAALADVTSAETSKLCAQTLDPGLNAGARVNYLPTPINPYLMKSPSPKNIIYSEPGLAPGGAGEKQAAPEVPPSVSAYTGLDGDQAPPAGYGLPPAVSPGPAAPEHLPAPPSPALYPGAPVPGPTNLESMLLPAEPAPPAGPTPAPASVPDVEEPQP